VLRFPVFFKGIQMFIFVSTDDGKCARNVTLRLILGTIIEIGKAILSGFGGLEVTCRPLDPKFAARGRRILQGEKKKILSPPSF
jgi:hypothetical protein